MPARRAYARKNLHPLTIKRRTAQRDQILDILDKARGPLTAPEIYSLARKDIPDIGLATIYRTLKFMQDEEKVRFVCLPDGVSRYEKEGLGRYHFKCRICQKIWTFSNALVVLSSSLAPESGFIIEEQDSTFYGLCPNAGQVTGSDYLHSHNNPPRKHSLKRKGIDFLLLSRFGIDAR